MASLPRAANRCERCAVTRRTHGCPVPPSFGKRVPFGRGDGRLQLRPSANARTELTDLRIEKGHPFRVVCFVCSSVCVEGWIRSSLQMLEGVRGWLIHRATVKAGVTIWWCGRGWFLKASFNPHPPCHPPLAKTHTFSTQSRRVEGSEGSNSGSIYATY